MKEWELFHAGCTLCVSHCLAAQGNLANRDLVGRRNWCRCEGFMGFVLLALCGLTCLIFNPPAKVEGPYLCHRCRRKLQGNLRATWLVAGQASLGVCGSSHLVTERSPEIHSSPQPSHSIAFDPCLSVAPSNSTFQLYSSTLKPADLQLGC